MKRLALFIGIVAGLVASCSTKEIDFQTPVLDDVVFYASFEQPAEEGTRVYANEDLLLRWTADDRITIFNKYTFNQEYRFNGETGDNSGSFKKVDNDDFVTGNELDNIYAIYPYLESTRISETGVITVTLPAEQKYAENTFGLGANTMVSATTDNQLLFKNVGGYLMLKLYGEGVSVKSITLKGNNGEKLAGEASVTMPLDGIPSVEMASEATTEITLKCDTPIQLGATEEESIQFWFVVPPVTFSKGFTITVKEGVGYIEKATEKTLTIERNKLSKMSPIEIEPDYGDLFVPFEDALFKAYCVDNFDTNADGEISRDEAKVVTMMSIDYNDYKTIKSLRGIEYFYNLTELYCSGCKIKSLDVSNNTALQVLYCGDNSLTSLNVSGCLELVYMNCSNNPLATLDVSNNTRLIQLYCNTNQLTSLNVCNNSDLQILDCNNNLLTSIDVSKNTVLLGLTCNDNQLTLLDISNNTKLDGLYCDANQLTSIDVSKNTLLTYLDCRDNKLTSLDLSNNPALTTLLCSCNQLTSIDVSNNTALTELECRSNQLTSIDVSNNAALVGLYCQNNPLLTEIWLKIGQSLSRLEYDTGIATIKYRGMPEAVDLGLSVKWASFNLGASMPEEYGDYFAWGETEPYYISQDPLTLKEGKDDGYGWLSYRWCMGTDRTMTKYCCNSHYGYKGFTDGKKVLDPEDDAAHVNLGGKWRMPTDAEWRELMENCTWTWTTQNRVHGRLITASNGNSIFLPAAGRRGGSSLLNAGSYGYYWSSSLCSDYPYDAWSVEINLSIFSTFRDGRFRGNSIRPVYAE